MTVLLLGSYNGQDSLGDKCLLRCVVARVRHAFGKDVRIITHVHNTAELHGPLRDLGIEARQGVQSNLWRWQSKISKVIKDHESAQKIAATQFAAIGRLIMAARKGGRLALQDLKDADAIIIYGGTNFSRQWWWLNTPAYILSSRWADVPVFLAPQQYGPMDSDQLNRFKEQLLSSAKTVLCRNPKDVELLSLSNKNDVLVRDEVFSNMRVYPTSENTQLALNQREPIILVNMRFSQDFLLGENEKALERFCDYVGEISQRLNLRIKLFCMSGWTFADDLAGRKTLEERLNGGERLEVLAYTDEYDLIHEASRARACISMSFHGVILSMIGGCPSIPVTLGEYYDYKYIGFSNYNPAAPIPLISLSSEFEQSKLKTCISYIEHFAYESVEELRSRSDVSIETTYGQLASALEPNTTSSEIK